MKTKIFTLTAIALLLTVAGAFATQPETVQGEYLEGPFRQCLCRGMSLWCGVR